MRDSLCVGGVVTALLEGIFEIDDRGDGYAEITLKGEFGETTATWREWDAQAGELGAPTPMGIQVTRKVIGRVHGDEGRVQAAHDAETGDWTRAESAFPGHVQLLDVGTCSTAYSSAPRVRVNSLQELEQYLDANRTLALQHLPAADRPEDIS